MAGKKTVVVEKSGSTNPLKVEAANEALGFRFSCGKSQKLKVSKVDGKTLEPGDEGIFDLSQFQNDESIFRAFLHLDQDDYLVVFGRRSSIEANAPNFGRAVPELLSSYSRSANDSGRFSNEFAVLTNGMWLETFGPRELESANFELLRSTLRVIKGRYLSSVRNKVASGGPAWQHLDSMLAKVTPVPWCSSLSTAQARVQLETFREDIAKLEYADAIAALVVYVDNECGSTVIRSPIVSDKTIATATTLRSARSRYIAEIQAQLDAAEGIDGQAFLTLAREVASISKTSGLLFSDAERPETVFQIETDSKAVWLREAVAGRSIQRGKLSRFPKVRVFGVEELTDQVTANVILAQDIKLAPQNQVSKMMPDEFFEYFDRVHEHVDREKLATQMQRWLDAFPEENRGFDDDFSKKRAFANALTNRVKTLGYRFKCLKNECDSSSGLCAAKFGNSKFGQFYFSHRVQHERVRHALTSKLPDLLLVANL